MHTRTHTHAHIHKRLHIIEMLHQMLFFTWIQSVKLTLKSRLRVAVGRRRIQSFRRTGVEVISVVVIPEVLVPLACSRAFQRAGRFPMDWSAVRRERRPTGEWCPEERFVAAMALAAEPGPGWRSRLKWWEIWAVETFLSNPSWNGLWGMWNGSQFGWNGSQLGWKLLWRNEFREFNTRLSSFCPPAFSEKHFPFFPVGRISFSSHFSKMFSFSQYILQASSTA